MNHDLPRQPPHWDHSRPRCAPCRPAGDTIGLSGNLHLLTQVTRAIHATKVRVNASLADAVGIGTTGISYHATGAVKALKPGTPRPAPWARPPTPLGLFGLVPATPNPLNHGPGDGQPHIQSRWEPWPPLRRPDLHHVSVRSSAVAHWPGGGGGLGWASRPPPHHAGAAPHPRPAPSPARRASDTPDRGHPWSLEPAHRAHRRAYSPSRAARPPGPKW